MSSAKFGGQKIRTKKHETARSTNPRKTRKRRTARAAKATKHAKHQRWRQSRSPLAVTLHSSTRRNTTETQSHRERQAHATRSHNASPPRSGGTAHDERGKRKAIVRVLPLRFPRLSRAVRRPASPAAATRCHLVSRCLCGRKHSRARQNVANHRDRVCATKSRRRKPQRRDTESRAAARNPDPARLSRHRSTAPDRVGTAR